MLFRYLLLCTIAAFFVFTIQVSADDVPSAELTDRANPAAKVVAKILGGLFASAAAGCLAEAAEQCKGHWKHPKEALSCGKNFLKNNKGRCAA